MGAVSSEDGRRVKNPMTGLCRSFKFDDLEAGGCCCLLYALCPFLFLSALVSMCSCDQGAIYTPS